MPQFCTGGLNTASTSITNYFSTTQFPLERSQTKVRPLLRQRCRRQCVVLRQENLREWTTSLPRSGPGSGRRLSSNYRKGATSTCARTTAPLA
ncbi:hypothetical protein DPMN_108474 [Dreissena polymorpha]|uniref:Uncharacterized protein n=1 Tax=Dreissena polymorpha TaxID=45954 RepID=A0A9D4K8T9_DREPO|nr:hypothetical protein DPMN_108474 [Dreissena polymorpha]